MFLVLLVTGFLSRTNVEGNAERIICALPPINTYKRSPGLYVVGFGPYMKNVGCFLAGEERGYRGEEPMLVMGGC